MKVKQVWANFGVIDLEKTNTFYTALGFKPNGSHHSEELTSFFFGEDDFVIHFFLKDKLKEAVHGELADLTRGSEIIFTLSVESKAEVDEWAKAVQKAGGTIVAAPEESKGYYTFVFSDPDGHKFNVFYM